MDNREEIKKERIEAGRRRSGEREEGGHNYF